LRGYTPGRVCVVRVKSMSIGIETALISSRGGICVLLREGFNVDSMCDEKLYR
jgi:hypothetical protein